MCAMPCDARSITGRISVRGKDVLERGEPGPEECVGLYCVQCRCPCAPPSLVICRLDPGENGFSVGGKEHNQTCQAHEQASASEASGKEFWQAVLCAMAQHEKKTWQQYDKASKRARP